MRFISQDGKFFQHLLYSLALYTLQLYSIITASFMTLHLQVVITQLFVLLSLQTPLGKETLGDLLIWTTHQKILLVFPDSSQMLFLQCLLCKLLETCSQVLQQTDLVREEKKKKIKKLMKTHIVSSVVKQRIPLRRQTLILLTMWK